MSPSRDRYRQVDETGDGKKIPSRKASQPKKGGSG